MAASLTRMLCRQSTFSKLNFLALCRQTSTVLQLKNIYSPSSYVVTRWYSSKSPENDRDCPDSGRNEDDEVKKRTTFGTVITQGPVRWLSKKVYMFLLKAYFDPEFDEDEFLRGAMQALIVTSEIFAEKRYEDLSKLCPPKLIDMIKDAMKTQEFGPAIKLGDIMIAKIKQIQLGYTDDQKKQVEIDVTFACHPKDLPTNQEVGNIKIVYVRSPKIVEYRFRKFCVPDEDDWILVGVNF